MFRAICHMFAVRRKEGLVTFERFFIISNHKQTYIFLYSLLVLSHGPLVYEPFSGM